MDDAPPAPAVLGGGPGRRGRWFPAALAVLAALLLWAADMQIVPVLRTTDVRTSSVDGVHEVVVELDAGTVTLRAGPGTTVGVRVVRTWLWPEPDPAVAVADGVLSVLGRCPGIAVGCTISAELWIPHGTSVRVTTGTGAVVVARLDVPVLELDSRAGTVDVVDVSAARVRARTGTGDVTVSFLRPPSVADVASGTGDVVLTVPAGRYRVDADGRAGTAVTDVVRDPGAARLLSARSSAGSVTIRSR